MNLDGQAGWIGGLAGQTAGSLCLDSRYLAESGSRPMPRSRPNCELRSVPVAVDAGREDGGRKGKLNVGGRENEEENWLAGTVQGWASGSGSAAHRGRTASAERVQLSRAKIGQNWGGRQIRDGLGRQNKLQRLQVRAADAPKHAHIPTSTPGSGAQQHGGASGWGATGLRPACLRLASCRGGDCRRPMTSHCAAPHSMVQNVGG